MNINMNYVNDILVKILKTPSPSGDTKEVIKLVEDEFKALNIQTKETFKGALIATIKGKNDLRERTLSAHVDTLGAMVKDIKDNGRLKLSQIGGYVWNSIEGEHCVIKTLDNKKYTGTILTNKASSHVHGEKASTVDRKKSTMEVRIDEKVNSKEDVMNLGINVGDFVTFDPRTTVTESGFVKSRHLDDKAGVASILGIAKYIKENNIIPEYTTNFFISNYEEVGHGSSASIPKKTSEFIAIDMAAPGEGQTSDEFSVTICAKDSSGPYDLELRNRLIKIAKENKIDYQIDIYPYYGSDASAALRAGWEFKHGLIGPGVDASHAHERTHLKAIENTIKLGIKYLI
ncbi:MAG: M42 family metallopeptidase [Firmicutes bacterium]|nr:M42 family metallopeptidase [Bacillota bacterium]